MVPPRCLQRDGFRIGQERLQGLSAVDLEGEAVGPNHHPPDAGVEIGRRGRWRQARPVRGEPRGVGDQGGRGCRVSRVALEECSHRRRRAEPRPEPGHDKALEIRCR